MRSSNVRSAKSAAVLAALVALAGCSPRAPQPPPDPPDYGPARQLLAEGQYRQAAEELGRQMARDPAPPAELRYAFALALANAGEASASTREALLAIDQVRGTPAEPVLWHLVLANALRAGDASQARDALSAMLARCEEVHRPAARQAGAVGPPGTASASREMAAARRALLEGNVVRATGIYSGVLELRPESPLVRLCLAECLRRLGDFAAARRFLDDVLPAALPHSPWRDLLVDAHRALYGRLCPSGA
ncbi:MAG: tetratricopeptide repeat protein [Candidatus Brocadiia bacterium]